MFTISNLFLFRIIVITLLVCGLSLASNAIRFSAESFSQISVLAKEGKTQLESIKEKANVAQYGPCWKNAVSELQVACKYLSENVQRDLALRFTDCFLQMSGHDPLNCADKTDACLKQLSDRAFNVYTEFYTHTQSICYFLQSQLWHEEAEKTIDKLSSTSVQVSLQLEEAEKTQADLLKQQKESILLQHDLINDGQTLASTLEKSQDRISAIMDDFQTYSVEQKQALFQVFEQLSSFKSWAIGEVSWLDSLLFYTASVILSYLFTSASRTQQARIYIFIFLTFNYFVERYICSLTIHESKASNETMSNVTDELQSNIWLCRKAFLLISIIVTLVMAYQYCDYNIVNHNILVDLKQQITKLEKQIDNLMNFYEAKNFCKPIETKVELLNNHVETSPFISRVNNIIPLPYVASPVSPMSYNKVSPPIAVNVDEKNSSLPSTFSTFEQRTTLSEYHKNEARTTQRLKSESPALQGRENSLEPTLRRSSRRRPTRHMSEA